MVKYTLVLLFFNCMITYSQNSTDMGISRDSSGALYIYCHDLNSGEREIKKMFMKSNELGLITEFNYHLAPSYPNSEDSVYYLSSLNHNLEYVFTKDTLYYVRKDYGSIPEKYLLYAAYYDSGKIHENSVGTFRATPFSYSATHQSIFSAQFEYDGISPDGIPNISTNILYLDLSKGELKHESFLFSYDISNFNPQQYGYGDFINYVMSLSQQEE